jgi:hypothetical protein
VAGITVCDALPRLVCGRSNKIQRGVAARGSNGHSRQIKEMVRVDGAASRLMSAYGTKRTSSVRPVQRRWPSPAPLALA